MTATAMWAPIIAWCALETLADSINAEKPEPVALDAFDRLRLRKPLAESFNALGFEGESGWRAAARIKIVLLAETKRGAQTPEQKTSTTIDPTKTAAKSSVSARPPAQAKRQPEHVIESALPDSTREEVAGLARDLWTDADVRWLTGVHDAGNHTYLVCEPYEELLWWLQMPQLLRIAGEPTPSKAEVQALSDKVKASSAVAARAEYRLDTMLARPVRRTGVPTDRTAAEMVKGEEQQSIHKIDGVKGTPDPAGGNDGTEKADSPISSRK